jgi:hypothetical protein
MRIVCKSPSDRTCFGFGCFADANTNSHADANTNSHTNTNTNTDADSYTDANAQWARLHARFLEEASTLRAPVGLFDIHYCRKCLHRC